MPFYMGVNVVNLYGCVIFSAPQNVAGCTYRHPIWVLCGRAYGCAYKYPIWLLSTGIVARAGDFVDIFGTVFTRT